MSCLSEMWKSESISDGPTDGLTRVGATDMLTHLKRRQHMLYIYLVFYLLHNIALHCNAMHCIGGRRGWVEGGRRDSP